MSLWAIGTHPALGRNNMVFVPDPGRPARGRNAFGRWSSAQQSQALHDRYHLLVRRIAARAMRAFPQNVAIDDAIAAGWLGLLDALGRRTEHMTDEHFTAFASFRVRGAILDHLRVLDPLSRSMRRASTQISRVAERLTVKLGRAPESEEIAEELGYSLEDYQRLLRDLNCGVVVTGDLSDHCEGESHDDLPETIVGKRRLLVKMEQIIATLPTRLRLVLSLYYQEERGFREIGQVLGVTESRACQLHLEAVNRIRAAFASEPVPSSSGSVSAVGPSSTH
ncbi:MAG TPA: sigma-70 family RNA polymerase sigma factor [Polyangiaceae bacterium]|nr:sigma-70 family RNA polymerase sigma factor [Polyangiaceae bacterium]